VERGWAAVQPVLDDPPPITFYEAGSWGPSEAKRIAAPGHWHDFEDER
jgi:glucose-6-phosphate 1-dehydrogenase